MESEPRTSARPRLQIIHFLVWTALCAVVLAVRSAWWEWGPMTPWDRALYTFGFIAFSMGYAAAIGGLLLLYWRWSRGGGKFFIAPGHWLLIFLAAAALFDGIGVLVNRLARHWLLTMPIPAAEGVEWNLDQLVQAAGGTVVCLFCAKYVRNGWEWTALFLLPIVVLVPMGIMCAAVLLRYTNWTMGTVRLAYTSQPVFVFLFVVWLAIVARRDAVSNPGRDWTHWVGVCMAFVMACIEGGGELIRLLRF